MCVFSYVFRSEKFKENLYFLNLYAIMWRKHCLFHCYFNSKIFLFSATTLPFWVASESYLLFLLTAKSLSSISPDSSSKKILDFVSRYLLLFAPSVSNSFIKTKSNSNYKKQLKLLFSLFYVIPQKVS